MLPLVGRVHWQLYISSFWSVGENSGLQNVITRTSYWKYSSNTSSSHGVCLLLPSTTVPWSLTHLPYPCGKLPAKDKILSFCWLWAFSYSSILFLQIPNGREIALSFLTAFTQHDVLQFHPYGSKFYHFFFFKLNQFLYPLICSWTLGLLPDFGYYEECLEPFSHYQGST